MFVYPTLRVKIYMYMRTGRSLRTSSSFNHFPEPLCVNTIFLKKSTMHMYM